MKQSEGDARDRIIRAAQDILEEVPDTDQVTVRDIAQRAGVGTGLVNYHFKSKDALLGIAIGDTMEQIIKRSSRTASPSDSPRDRLVNVLAELCDLAMGNRKLMRFVLSQSLADGDTGTPLHLMPFLKDLFGEDADEMRLRVAALQILHPLQVTALSPKEFETYTGFDLEDAGSRKRFVVLLVDNLAPEAKEERP